MFYEPVPTKLEVKKLGLKVPGEIGIATVIAEETEAERERQRKKFPDKVAPNKTTNRLVGLLSPETYGFSYADSLRWDQLLTFDKCASICAKRCGIKPEEVIEFASRVCNPYDIWLLFWYERFLWSVKEQISESIRATSHLKAIKKFEDAQQRAVETRRAAGIASGKIRQASARVPPREKLLHDYALLLQTGTEQRNIVSKLASRYRVSPQSIYKKLGEHKS